MKHSDDLVLRATERDPDAGEYRNARAIGYALPALMMFALTGGLLFWLGMSALTALVCGWLAGNAGFVILAMLGQDRRAMLPFAEHATRRPAEHGELVHRHQR